MVNSKGYSGINILGLSIGMLCCILILFWIQNELSYDRFHKKSKDIYRIIVQTKHQHGIEKSTLTPPPLAEILTQKYPEIFNSTRINSGGKMLFKYKDNAFYENKGILTDHSFFEIFSFPFFSGNPETALTDPLSIIITQRMAEKYFGSENPINKVIKVENLLDFKVTAVIQDIPENSHLKFDFIMSTSIMGKDALKSWESRSCYTYILLNAYASVSKLNDKISDELILHIPNSKDKISLQPLLEIYHYSNFKDDLATHGNIKSLILLSIIALLILIIASINFINISIAQFGAKAKEIGVRKIVGATKNNLFNQYFIASCIMILIAFILSMFLVYLLLPYFNTITGKYFTINMLNNKGLILLILFLIAFTAFIAGGYPSLLFSKQQPVNIIKNVYLRGAKKANFRRLLVIMQFSLSVILIIGTMVIYKQLNFLSNKNLGFDKNNIIYMPLRGDLGRDYEKVRNELIENKNIEAVTVASGLMAEKASKNWAKLRMQGTLDFEPTGVYHLSVDHNFLSTFNISVEEGRGFSKEFVSDFKEAFLVNQTFVKKMGLHSPLGKKCTIDDKRGEIIGVVKDFHFNSLHHQIKPLALSLSGKPYYYLFIKIKDQNISDSVHLIEEIWRKYNTGYPPEYQFFDEALLSMYNFENRIGTILTYFTLFALIISSLGLFGLTSLLIDKCVKEIGIRKVFGSSTFQIVFLLSKEFVLWAVFANLIAWPIAWYAMNQWLQTYAYHINVELENFLYSGLISIIIVIVTVSYKTIKAATANPVNSLRYE